MLSNWFSHHIVAYSIAFQDNFIVIVGNEMQKSCKTKLDTLIFFTI